jgi:outer membrane protein assembly factor BamB
MLDRSALVALCLCGAAAACNSPPAAANEQFPVDERNISVPIVDHPIHDCAMAVHVSSFIPKATVAVFAGGVEVGHDTPLVGFADIPLARPLVLGESITARQTFSGVTSDPSDEVTVEAYPMLTKPVMAPVLYACGLGVAVDNLVASTHVEIADLSAPGAPVIGTGETTGPHTAISVSPPLTVYHGLQATQIACPTQPARKSSPSSEIQGVSVSPNPPPKPTVDDMLPPGSEVATVRGLFLGAEVEIMSQADVVSSGHWATSPETWFALTRPVLPGRPRMTATQTLCSKSLPSDPVFPPDDIEKPTIVRNVCAGARNVFVDGTFTNATVALFRRRPPAAAPVSIGQVGGWTGNTVTMTFGKAGTLADGDVLSAVQFVGAIVSAHSDEVTVGQGCGHDPNVVTQHNDNFRTGAYLAETSLSPASIRARGMQRQFLTSVTGGVVTQPLYVRGVQFGSGEANAVFVGTTKNHVYALDARNGAVKWDSSLADDKPSVRPVAQGILNTPVIDVAAGLIYVLFETGKRDQRPDDFRTNAASTFWLVALRLQTGGEVARVEIAPSAMKADGSGVVFMAKDHTGHPALLLDRGSLYLGFGARADSEGDHTYYPYYHGWVLQYRASDLSLQASFCTAPNDPTRANTLNHDLVAPGAGVWHGGGGLAADPDGNVYALTGNGRTELANALYADAFLKLTPRGGWLVPTAFTLSIGESDQLEAGDADLASGGPLVLPGFNLVMGGGKTGYMYLLERSAMNVRQRLTAATSQYPDPYGRSDPASRSGAWDSGPHLHGSPTFWPGAGRLYVWGEKDFLRVYAFNPVTQQFGDNPIKVGDIKAQQHTMPGGMMSLSANGSALQTGVVWATFSIDDVMPGGDASRAELFAFDAVTLDTLWDNTHGLVPRWAPPTVADGTVFVGTLDQDGVGEVLAYGLGTDPSDLNWTPYTPKLSSERCQGCHTDQQREELGQRNPLGKYYVDESAVRAERVRAQQAVAPPSRGRPGLVLEGNGFQVYAATAPGGGRGGPKPVWTLRETTADLAEVGPDGLPKKEGARVRLAPGPVWTASDGSALAGRVEKSTPAPAQASTPWALYKVVRHGGHGVLGEQSYVQCLYTHAGRAPAAPPRRAGDVARVPYMAQYWFYK